MALSVSFSLSTQSLTSFERTTPFHYHLRFVILINESDFTAQTCVHMIHKQRSKICNDVARSYDGCGVNQKLKNVIR